MSNNNQKGRPRRNPHYYLPASSSNLSDSDEEVDCSNIRTSIGKDNILSNISNFNQLRNINLIMSVNQDPQAALPQNNVQNEQQNPPQPRAQLPMAQLPTAQLDIFQALRVPDAIKDLPKFDGNPRLLFEFIHNVEEILSLIPHADGTVHSKILLRAVRNKVVGPANEVLNMYGTPLIWAAIRSNLVLHYSDKRNETSLIRDLHTLRQSHNTVEQFYSNVIEIFATISNHVQVYEENPVVIKAKSDLYSEMCLNTFLVGLREPLGSTVRAMKPKSLPEAFSFCIKEQNIFYAKSEFNPGRTLHKKTTDPTDRFTQFSQQLRRQLPAVPQRTSPPYNGNNRYIQQQPIFQQRPQQQPIYQQTTQQQPIFQQRAQQQPAYQNQFQRHQQLPQTQRRLPPPEPMELGSGNTRQTRSQQHSNLFRQNGPSRFTNQELHNITTDNQSSNYQQLDPYYDYEQLDELDRNLLDTFHELDDTNFQLTAPKKESDT